MRYNVGMGYSTSRNYNSTTLSWSAFDGGRTTPVYHDGLEFKSIELDYNHATRNVYVKAIAFAYSAGTRTELNLPIFAISEAFLENFGFDMNHIMNPQNSTITDFVDVVGKIGMWQEGVQRLYKSLPDNNKNQLKKELEEKDRRIQELEEIIHDLKEDLEMARALAVEI